MKLYKFRSLTTSEDLERAKEIIETGCFWCSTFSELNDPMEGIFTTFDRNCIDNVYKEKSAYKICSFSKEKALGNPTLWGYYAGGFKGIVIELVVNDDEVCKVKYVRDIQSCGTFNPDNVERILSTKLTPWKHEVEYRFLRRIEHNKNVIGNITAIYFGNPYGNVLNKHEIFEYNQHLKDYGEFRGKLIETANEKKIKCFLVDIEGSLVIPRNDVILLSEREN